MALRAFLPAFCCITSRWGTALRLQEFSVGLYVFRRGSTEQKHRRTLHSRAYALSLLLLCRVDCVPLSPPPAFFALRAVLFNMFDVSGSGLISKKELLAMSQAVVIGAVHAPVPAPARALFRICAAIRAVHAGSQKPQWTVSGADASSVGFDYFKPLLELQVEAAMTEVRFSLRRAPLKSDCCGMYTPVTAVDGTDVALVPYRSSGMECGLACLGHTVHVLCALTGWKPTMGALFAARGAFQLAAMLSPLPTVAHAFCACVCGVCCR